MTVDRRQASAVAYLKGTKHRFYEDSFRMLPREIFLVESRNRGEVFAVFDGIGSAAEGRHAAQFMADQLVEFFRQPDEYPATTEGMQSLLFEGNNEINSWGFKPGTDIPLGGCAGTVIWILAETLHVFHAGDTCGLHIRDDEVVELTQPHQLPDGAIYRFFGMGQDLTIDVNSISIDDYDRILLMSDGVTDIIQPMEAARLTVEHVDIARAVDALAKKAQILGATDDFTAMLVEIEEIWEP